MIDTKLELIICIAQVIPLSHHNVVQQLQHILRNIVSTVCLGLHDKHCFHT